MFYLSAAFIRSVFPLYYAPYSHFVSYFSTFMSDQTNPAVSAQLLWASASARGETRHGKALLLYLTDRLTAVILSGEMGSVLSILCS